MNGIRKIGLLTLSAILVMGWGTGAFAGLPGDLPKAIAMEKIQIPFIENRGQADGGVAFYARTFGGTFFVTRDGEMVLVAVDTSKKGQKPIIIRECLAGSKNHPISGVEPSPTLVSTFVGKDPSRWHKGMPTYKSISLGEVYEGIQLNLRAYGKNVEKVFTVKPGADPRLIRVKVSGAKNLKLTEKGGLAVETAPGSVTFTPPVAYQESTKGRQHIQVAYSVKENAYSFEIKDYDRTRDLIIDPLIQSTYLGGSGNDFAEDIAIDALGNVYVTGKTTSINFPVTSSGWDTVGSVNGEVFVVKLNEGLTLIESATYLGGLHNDEGKGIQIHPYTGDVYVTGSTNSQDFPNMSSGAQSIKANGFALPDAFIARLNANLTDLLGATYLGGDNQDIGTDITIRYEDTPAKNNGYGRQIYVSGDTESDVFPMTDGGGQSFLRGNRDAYVACLNAHLTTLHQTSYFGGVGLELGGPIVFNSGTGDFYGDVYIAGGYSLGSDTLTGSSVGVQPYHGATTNGWNDNYVARFNSTLTIVRGSTFLGGDDDDEGGGQGLAFDPVTESVYVIGHTYSDNFTGYAGSALDADVYVAKLDTALSTITTVLLGGSQREYGFGAAIHQGTDEVFVTGETGSTDFPATGGAQQTFGDVLGYKDAFVARFPLDLSTLNLATYLGGSSDATSTGSAAERGRALAINTTTGDVYVAGITDSFDFPERDGGADPNASSVFDGFVARFDHTLALSSGCTDIDGDLYCEEVDDCDDSDADINPGANEVCDGVDNDCDDLVDDFDSNVIGQNAFYADTDGDSYGDPDLFSRLLTCASATPQGYTTDNTDCDDTSAEVNPGAAEVCNGIDDDCANGIDDGFETLTYYYDSDDDGYGDSTVSVTACSAPTDYVLNDTDCNDQNAAVNPGATEICNGIDDDCNGLADIEDGLTEYTYFRDLDADNFGSVSSSLKSCEASPPSGFLTDNSDCNDSNAAINPDALELCFNEWDDDCDGDADCDDLDCDNSISCQGVVLEPSSYAFGQVEVGDSKAVTVTLRNQNTVLFTVTNIYTTDFTGSEDNWTLEGLPAVPFDLPGLSERTFDITLVPQTEGAFQTRIGIDFNSGLNYTSGWVTGEGIPGSGGGGGGGGCNLSSPSHENGIDVGALIIFLAFGLYLARRKRQI